MIKANSKVSILIFLIIITGTGLALTYNFDNVFLEDQAVMPKEALEKEVEQREAMWDLNRFELEHSPLQTEISSIFPGLDLETITEESDQYTLSMNRILTDSDELTEDLNEWSIAQKNAIQRTNGG
ncbi:hypothetical protein [Salisediminibacterium selenitireducens]|uniref:Uncharacterized protein n=1 Tax=Bacillus selenitireducens (strain ATCC 700615 / DSM 15326 / MLS10) TaxID=439292 RepID=D6XXX2_BACIE|nr:hypothetical protein [Salisediminibacterium selenitireducens]ADI00165.1 hypothetical protein Bsel_2665 [[Bacillus] selenitireducens MLS10]